MKTRTYQTGSPDGRRQMEIGSGETSLGIFRPAGLMDQLRGVMLRGEIQGAPCALMLPTPWNGSKWRVLERERELATAENLRTGPLRIKSPAAFDVAFQGRVLRLEATDDHGFEFRLTQGGEVCGSIRPRAFEPGARWHAELEAPEELPAAVAAFLAWLAREGRRRLEMSKGRR